MSHHYTSRANLTIGSLRLIAPELVHDSDSEGGTPLVTPIHTKFGNISNSPIGAAGTSIAPGSLTCGEYSRLDKHHWKGGMHDCPPAPRIDNGSFECGLAYERNSTFVLDTFVNSSIDAFEDNCPHGFNKVSTHLHTEDPRYSRAEVGQPQAISGHQDSNALEDHCGIWTIPPAPRPETGSWSSSTENVAPIVHWSRNSEKKRTFHTHTQFRSVAYSASVKNGSSNHPASNGIAQSTEHPSPEPARNRIAKWNLGLGLTLDDIAEPDGYGSSADDLSMEFAEDSSFDLDTESGCCSTADTTLNTTTETIPDLAMPCPNGPAGSSQASGPNPRITSRLRMFSFQGHQANVKRQRIKKFPASRSGALLAYTSGILSETDFACLVGRLRIGEHCGFGGLLNDSPLEFAAGEYSLSEAQGEPEYQITDAPIFTLLPPIEL